MVLDVFRCKTQRAEAPPDAAPPDGVQPPAEGAGVPESLERTRGGLFGAVRSLFKGRRELDESFWDDLEERLLQADVGAHTTADLVDALREQNDRRPFASPEQAEAALREELQRLLPDNPGLNLPRPLSVILVAGVNGVGKTTSIAKLAHYLSRTAGRKPILAAGDTFRAAAIDQLKVWGERAQVPV